MGGLRYLFAVVLGLFILTVSSPLYGQAESATISGRISDSSGAVLPDVSVQLQSAEKGVIVQTTTNGAGLYVFPSVSPGIYNIRVRKDGFQTEDYVGLTANTQDHLEQNFRLTVGAVSQSITVTAETADINTTDGTVSTVVDRQLIENIPLNGRSFQSLIMLTPGVVATKANFNEQGQFSINGQRADANYYTVDGVSANFGVNAGGGGGQAAGGTLPATSVGGGFNNLVSVDALQEFRIQTSTYAPEFGRSPGGQISLVSRSGTNGFHGSVFDYVRNDLFDANDWFADNLGLAKPEERQNDFGGVFGGPIFKDKTFLFFSYEGLRLRQPQVRSTEVPSLSLRQGASAPLQTLLNAFPIPNGADRGNGLALFSGSFSVPSTLDAASLRLDHHMNNVTLFARYNYSPSNTKTRPASTQLNNFRVSAFGTRTLTAGASWLISPTMTNEFRANWSRQNGGTQTALDNFGGAVPFTGAVLPSNFPQQNTFFRVTVLSALTTSEIFGPIGQGTQGQLNFVDNLSLTKGSHQLKFGVDYRYLFPSAYSAAAELSYAFRSMADVLANQITSVNTGANRPRVDYAYSNFSTYAQDTWKASGRLTLTYGVRWDVNPAPHGRNGTVFFAATSNDPATLAFAPAGTPLWATSYNNFAPRFGLAYKLNDSGSTVVRGGFGVFYDLAAGSINNANTLYPNSVSGPGARKVPYPPDPSSVIIPPLPSTTNPGVPGSSGFQTFVADPNLKTPYTKQWNVALEHAFDAKQTVTLTYLGAAGRSLVLQEEYFNASMNFPDISINRNDGASNYNALQAQYQRRLSHGLQGLASYTWSHSLDNASNDSTSVPGSDQINENQNRGPSDFDVRQTFAGALTYDIPMVGPAIAKVVLGNWSVDSIFTARTATPVDVTISRDLGFGVFDFRPDLVPGIPFYLVDPTVGGGQRINNTVVGPQQLGPFVVPTALRQGTLGRNALRGFSYNQLNFSLRRQINFTEHINLRFQADFFNIFNHPNFADPSGQLGSVDDTGAVTFATGTFGISPSMLNSSLGTGGQVGGFNPLYGSGGPRSIQLSLKFAF